LIFDQLHDFKLEAGIEFSAFLSHHFLRFR
jgi:hypothetical protein